MKLDAKRDLRVAVGNNVLATLSNTNNSADFRVLGQACSRGLNRALP